MSNNAEIHWETVQNEYPFDDIKKVLSIVFKIWSARYGVKIQR